MATGDLFLSSSCSLTIVFPRVPKEKKGPLDTFWKIRDAEGYILNYDKTRSACVHQWDRFHDEIYPWLRRTFG
jgi:hypothetical protein